MPLIKCSQCGGDMIRVIAYNGKGNPPKCLLCRKKEQQARKEQFAERQAAEEEDRKELLSESPAYEFRTPRLVPCVKCGEEVERVAPVPNTVCFSFKQKRKSKHIRDAYYAIPWTMCKKHKKKYRKSCYDCTMERKLAR